MYPSCAFEPAGYRKECNSQPPNSSSKEKINTSQYRWREFQGECSLTISEKTEDMSKATHNACEQVRYMELTATSYANKLESKNP